MIKNDNLYWGYDKVWCVGRENGKLIAKECDIIEEYSNALLLHCDDWKTDGEVFNDRYFYILKDSSDLFIDKIEANEYLDKHIKGVTK